LRKNLTGADTIMIETLDKGTRLRRIVQCHDCRSKLRFEAADVVCFNAAIGYAGETWEPRYVIVCPECGEDIYVGNKINDRMKQEAEDRLRAKEKL
jgi:hypothetical protein